MIAVEIVYALTLEQDSSSLLMEEGARVADAIDRSGVRQRHPEIDLSRDRVAIFGRAVTLQTLLRDRDRVEILRPLIVDPKEARRRRAQHRRRVARRV
jgi:putative ubiquitin-RnfH superfamily antitoxin RatB of RatAB toxin-antitoxin module